MRFWLKLLPWFWLGLFGAEIVAVMSPRPEGVFHTAEFGRLPVLLNGRVQPLDSVARNALLQIRSTGDVPLEEVPSWQFWHHPAKLRSTEWLVEVLFRPAVADTRRIFLIHHPELLGELRLTNQGAEKSGLRYYSFNELAPVLKEVMAQAQQAAAVEDARRSTYQQQVLKLANALDLYQRLQNSIEPAGAADFAGLVAAYEAALPAARAAARGSLAEGSHEEPALKQVMVLAQQFTVVAKYAYPLAVPPLDPAQPQAWKNVGQSLVDSLRSGQVHPAVGWLARMAAAYERQDAVAFNGAVDEYRGWLETRFAREVAKGRAENYFNRTQVFLHAMIIYLMGFVLAGAALLTLGLAPGLSESLRRSAFYLIGLAFAVHTFGLVFRMVLEGRPPVTNLYSSAVFIGWGACVLGLVLERVYRIGLGSAVAGLAGFVTLLIAHNLALGGDTMEMLRAVLDTNFWLAAHVVVVTLGYSSTFVAGGLAAVYVLLGLFTPLLTTELGGSGGTAARGGVRVGQALADMVYAIVCFATLFSFVGTVLGGIWADQSWGRFWGWDPKENGALLIVLWNAIILHARWAGMVRERGLMLLAIFGNIVTAFSWFGVNMLGIGLHSYGFMDAAFRWLMLFDASQAVLIVLGLLPLSWWRSYREGSPRGGASVRA